MVAQPLLLMRWNIHVRVTLHTTHYTWCITHDALHITHNTWHKTTHGTLHTYTRDTTHSYVWRQAFIRVTWGVWHDAFTPVTWCIHTCDMTHSHLCYDAFILDSTVLSGGHFNFFSPPLASGGCHTGGAGSLFRLKQEFFGGTKFIFFFLVSDTWTLVPYIWFWRHLNYGANVLKSCLFTGRTEKGGVVWGPVGGLRWGKRTSCPPRAFSIYI